MIKYQRLIFLMFSLQNKSGFYQKSSVFRGGEKGVVEGAQESASVKLSLASLFGPVLK